MRRSIEEQAKYMLEKMTVDMSIDLWQTKECAMAACDICIDALQDAGDSEVQQPAIIYWMKVKQRIQETR
jgi:hypothetical protein